MNIFIRFISLILLLIFRTSGMHGQCTFVFDTEISDTSTTTIQIEVEDLVNSDLGVNQQVCAIELHFQHSYLGDVTIDLVSPAGESIQLVGPVTDQINPTNLTTWDVRFVQCGFPAAPDAGFTAQWNNAQAWAVLTTYNGTYYPSAGCLEDLDMGSANGIWQIVITDHDPLQTGTFLGVTLVFCDDTGLDCGLCGADAGSFSDNPLSICEASLLDIGPEYTDTMPDPVIYGYSYLIGDDMGGISVQANVNTSVMGPGLFTICGVSYTYSDSAALFAELDTMTLNEIQSAFINGDIEYCADLVQNCLVLEIGEFIDTTFRQDVICSGSSVTIGNQTFNTPGIHVVNIEVPGACDSVVVLDLGVIQVDARVTQADTISCANPQTILDGSSSIVSASAVFTWSTLDGMIIGPTDQQSITISGAGTFTLTIADQGCIDMVNYTVIGDESIPFISVEGGTITCSETTFTLDPVIFPTNVNIQWNGPGGFTSALRNPTVDVPGIYYLLVTQPDGCSASAAVEVGIDTISITPLIQTTIDCINQRTRLRALPGDLIYQDKFSWTGPGGFTFQFASFWATVPGTYCVTLTPGNGCPATTCIDVQEDYTIPDVDVQPQEDSLHCGTFVSLVANSITPQVSYSWFGPAGSFSSATMVDVVSAGMYIATVSAPNGCSNRDTAVVFNGSDIFFAETFGDTLNCNVDTGLIGVVTFEPGATYTWSGPGVIDTFSAFTQVASPGIYVVSVSSNGCTQILNASVTGDYSQPNFTPFTDTITCDEPIAELSMLIASPFSEITWQLPDGTISHDSLLFSMLPGSYILTLERENGCRRTRTIVVPADTIPPRLFMDSPLLGCDSVAIEVVATDSIRSYTWSGPGGFTSMDPNPLVSEGGFYILEAIATNGCASTKAHFVDTNYTVPIIDVSAEELDCLDSSAMLNVTSPDTNVTFEWYNSNGVLIGDSVAIVSGAGTYLVIATGENRCMAIDSVNLVSPEYPAIQAFTDTITCVSDAELIAVSDLKDVTISWTDSDGNLGTGPVFQTSNAGLVMITATWTNGCQTDTSIIVGIDTMAPLAIATSNEMVLCNQQTVTLDASMSVGQMLSYFWTTQDGLIDSGGDSAQPTVTGEGAYIVMVTDNMNGCTDSDTIQVIEGQGSLGVIELTAISECEGNGNGSITVDNVPGAATPLQYFLDGQAGGPMFSGLSSGEYLLSVQDTFGCQTDSVITITNTGSSSSVNLGADRVIVLGDSVQLNATINLDPGQLLGVTWLQQVPCDSCLTNNVGPLTTTQYEVQIEDIFGCIAKDQVTIFVEERAHFYIPNAFSPNGDEINDVVQVVTHPGVARVDAFTIFDRWGDVVFRATDFDASNGTNGWDGTAEGRETNPGVFVYLLELKLLTGRTEIFTGTITLLK